MSTGAELSVVAIPVGAIGLVLAAGAIAAAGLVVVSGVAVVGAGRLMVSAGSYARERMQERAVLCTGEYERFLRLRAAAKARAAVKPTIDRAVWQNHVAEESVVPLIVEPIASNLMALQKRHDILLRQATRRAQLAAALTIHGAVLPPDVTGRARAALNEEREEALERALGELRGAIARADLDVLARAQAELGEHRMEVADLLAQLTQPGLYRELEAWHSKVNAMLGSRDIAAIREHLRQGTRLLSDVRERHDEALHRLRAAELGSVWGLLQAVDALIKDLQLLANHDEGAHLLRTEILLHVEALAKLAARYEQLATGPVSQVAVLRADAAELQRQLELCQDAALQLLDRHYQGRIVNSVATSLGQMCGDQAPFADFKQEAPTADGRIVMRASRGARTLEVCVHADGRVVYDADGFGDETCLGAIYELRARLRAQGVEVELADPQLKPQVAMALQALEAISSLGIYPADTITIQKSGSALVIEAGSGPGFQRQVARIDRQGQVSYDQQLPQLDQGRAQRAVQTRVAKERARGKNQQLEREQREQRQGKG